MYRSSVGVRELRSRAKWSLRPQLCRPQRLLRNHLADTGGEGENEDSLNGCEWLQFLENCLLKPSSLSSSCYSVEDMDLSANTSKLLAEW